jgi:hypothetical protein
VLLDGVDHRLDLLPRGHIAGHGEHPSFVLAEIVQGAFQLQLLTGTSQLERIASADRYVCPLAQCLAR